MKHDTKGLTLPVEIRARKVVQSQFTYALECSRDCMFRGEICLLFKECYYGYSQEQVCTSCNKVLSQRPDYEWSDVGED